MAKHNSQINTDKKHRLSRIKRLKRKLRAKEDKEELKQALSGKL